MLLALGLGYSARAVAARWRTRGARVAGTVRTGKVTREANRAAGITLAAFDASAPLRPIEELLAQAAHVVVSIPPHDDDAKGSTPDLTLLRLADSIARTRNIVWLAYLSTTGVYGDRAGDWVDETSARRPGNAHSLRRAAVEDAWLALWRDRGVPVHIFRLSGIYGPGRSAIDQMRAGTTRRIDKPGQVFSRIHVDDIANVLEASAARPRPGSIYNVADDAPAPAAAVVEHAAALLGMPAPPLEAYEPEKLSPMAQSFYAETRRISNARIKRELGVRLQFPDYKAGLDAILRG